MRGTSFGYAKMVIDIGLIVTLRRTKKIGNVNAAQDSAVHVKKTKQTVAFLAMVGGLNALKVAKQSNAIWDIFTQSKRRVMSLLIKIVQSVKIKFVKLTEGDMRNNGWANDELTNFWCGFFGPLSGFVKTHKDVEMKKKSTLDGLTIEIEETKKVVVYEGGIGDLLEKYNSMQKVKERKRGEHWNADMKILLQMLNKIKAKTIVEM